VVPGYRSCTGLVQGYRFSGAGVFQEFTGSTGVHG
jgi:hypothetical protein